MGRDVLADQIAYYRARAAEYDQGYDPAGKDDPEAWSADFEALTERFTDARIAGDVLELAAGTGWWTSLIARRAAAVTALDASPEMLEINRARLGPLAGKVTYRVADLFEWRPERVWDACVMCFWICHVPDAELARFTHLVAEAVRPGGLVLCVDKKPDAAARVMRTVCGQSFTIVDQPRPADELVKAFGGAGIEMDVSTVGERFSFGVGRAASSAPRRRPPPR